MKVGFYIYFFINIDSDGKEPACYAEDLGLIPGSGRSPGEAHGNQLQYSCLGNPWIDSLVGLQSMGSQRVRHDWATNTLFLMEQTWLYLNHVGKELQGGRGFKMWDEITEKKNEVPGAEGEHPIQYKWKDQPRQKFHNDRREGGKD